MQIGTNEIAERILKKATSYMQNYIDIKRRELKDYLKEVGRYDENKRNVIQLLLASLDKAYDEANDIINKKDDANLNEAIQKLLAEPRKSQQKFLKASVVDIVDSIIQQYWEPVIDMFATPRFKGDKVIDDIVGDLYSVDFQQFAIDCVVEVIDRSPTSKFLDMEIGKTRKNAVNYEKIIKKIFSEVDTLIDRIVANELRPLIRYFFDAQDKMGENAKRDSLYNFRTEFYNRTINFEFAASGDKLFNYYREMKDESLSEALQVYFSTDTTKQEEKAKEIVCNKITQIVEHAIEPVLDELGKFYGSDELVKNFYDKISSINYPAIVETSFYIATDPLKLERTR